MLYYARTDDLNHTRPVTDATLGAIFVATGGHKRQTREEEREREKEKERNRVERGKREHRQRKKVRFRPNLALVLQLPPVLSPDCPY